MHIITTTVIDCSVCMSESDIFVPDIMSLKKLFFFVSIFVVIPAYFLYTPIPDGYSTMSACKMQLTLATVKMVGAVVCMFVCMFTEIICRCSALEMCRDVRFLTLL